MDPYGSYNTFELSKEYNCIKSKYENEMKKVNIEDFEYLINDKDEKTINKILSNNASLYCIIDSLNIYFKNINDISTKTNIFIKNEKNFDEIYNIFQTFDPDYDKLI